ncbi:MAG: hypothetical protein GPJ01_00165 [Microcystis aeruginosa LL13-06]|jgi:hypothetical protein|nr:hypothetical protein [Microcystis aeruginosa SX13-11]NCR56296.1 hypothetical protein [Microcystis aeruginosa LL13-06]
MNPKFKDITAWEQAQLLMQPAFIRVLDNLRKQLENSLWKGTYTEIQDPYPSYLLCLTYLDRSVTVNIWELCFQVCFLDYPTDEGESVVIDTSLLDPTGELDWQSLETKTERIIKQLFANLPQ